MQPGRVVTSAPPVPSLTRWALSPDADLVYRLLVHNGPLDPSSAARELGMARRRVASALEELAAAGAVTPGTGTAGARRWCAVAPPVLLERLLQRGRPVVDPLAVARRHLEAVTGTELSWPAGPAPRVRTLGSAEAIRQRVEVLRERQRAELLTSHPPDGRPSAEAVVVGEETLRLLARGVAVRTLGTACGDTELDRCPELVRLGGVRRVADAVPTKLMIFDRRVVLLPADPLRAERGVLEVAEPTLVATLVGVFERAWERARDPGPSVRVVLTGRERRLVELLLAGHSDATAAGRLGVSVRTVGYTLRHLMDRYGVDNRLQLGVVLATGLPSLASALPSPAPSPDPSTSPAPAPSPSPEGTP
ncbi:LuxR C-terminal-related transcriptional regulator [Kitasatospora aureofaciens]|uniref:helix-turn-helix transcriptional regulator n=1 Tax=Kitasatospora aureofaciens TaxID=1894 RepID=UPI0038115F3A